jgi:hypothetical protein
MTRGSWGQAEDIHGRLIGVTKRCRGDVDPVTQRL